jgi:hypothetical protein
MAGYAQYQGNGVAGVLALHLGLYAFVAGCYSFSLYELMQPAQTVNPGLAAYKPPPATVIGYGASLPHGAQSHPVPSEPVVLAAPVLTSEPETTERPVPTLEPTAPDTQSRPRREAKKPNPTKTARREVKSEPSRQMARVACIARYDSSGAQTGGC